MTLPRAMNSLKPSKSLLEKSNMKDLGFRRILTTAPRQYQDRLAATIIRFGGRPIWIPGIQINELKSQASIEARDASLKDLHGVNYILLPSKSAIFSCLHAFGNSISAFQRKLNVEHGDIQVWAMGADADYLRDTLGIKYVRKPMVSSTNGIIDTMKKESIQPGNALVFVPDVMAPLTEPCVVPEFLRNLQTIGITPLRIPAYETCIGPSERWVQPEIDMLLDGCINAIAFTSTAEAEGLSQIVGRDKLIQCIKSHNIVVAAHGSTTANGVSNILPSMGEICISKDSSTFEGMISALCQEFVDL